MQAKGWVMVRVLLNRYHPHVNESLVQCLPEDDAKAVLAQEINTDNVSEAVLQSQQMINRIHYSWLVPAIQKLPKALHQSVLPLISKDQAEKLAQLLHLSSTNIKPLSQPVRTFLSAKLFDLMGHPSVLPVAYLPHTALTTLANMNKPQLLEIIDLLGIYDLAEEVRHIIDQKRIKQIFSCLNTKKKQFLGLCLHQKEKMSSSRMRLDQWDGECEKLDSLLHRRGMTRLGKALSGQHPDLLWHISHTLDTGRGNLLTSTYSSAAIQGVTPILAQQVLNVINFINPSKSTS